MKAFLNRLTLFFTLLLILKGACAQSSRIDSLLLQTETSQGEELVENYFDLSKEYLYISPSKAIEYANKALSIAKENNNEELEAYSEILLGTGYIFAGELEEGKIHSEKGLELARIIDNKDYICSGLNSLGAYYINVGEYKQSLDFFQEAFELAKNQGLDDKAATAQMNIGSILTNTGQSIEGLRNLLDAMDYFENENNPQIMSRIYNNIALSYHATNKLDKALEFYNKALAIYEESNDLIGQITIYNNLGEIFKDKKEYSNALDYFQKTIDISDNIEGNKDFYKAYGWIGLAETYIYLNNNQAIRDNATLALNVFESVNMQEGVAHAKLALATVNFEENSLNEALNQVNQVLEISQRTGLIEVDQKAYELKAKILYKNGWYEQAYETFRLYNQTTDSILAQERSQELAQMQLNLELSEKENEIEILQKNNEITDLKLKRKTTQTHYLIYLIALLILVFGGMLISIRNRKKTSDLIKEKNQQIQKQHKELTQANESKDRFLSIIAHDLRNPIGAFKDVIGQLADFPDMFSEELRQQIINELRDEAESTYFLLDNLLFWAKNQKHNIQQKFEELDVSAIINNNILINSRFSESKSIELSSKIDEDFSIYADFNMVNLILRNLISNAIKFTNENGKVTITAKENGDYIDISIKDTGVGIPEDIVTKLFDNTRHVSTYGTKHEKGAGLGLLLCKEFTDINNGKITVESKINQGSTFTVSFKKYTNQIQSSFSVSTQI